MEEYDGILENNEKIGVLMDIIKKTDELRSLNMIYLDNAATTFPKPERVYDALEVANRELSFNAGRGSYKAARDASAVIDDTKKRLRSLSCMRLDMRMWSSLHL